MYLNVKVQRPRFRGIGFFERLITLIRYTLIIHILGAMARTKRLQLLLTEQEFESLKKYAESKNLSVSEILRDYIKSL